MTKPKSVLQVIKRACTDKVSLSLEEANQIIDRKANQGIVWYFYKCRFCNRYHISKNDSTKQSVEII